MSPQRAAFLALSIWGAVHPMYWFVSYINATGTGPGGMIDAWYVNASTTGLTWDLTISALALTFWVVTEAIPAAFGIGVSCGLPLYLFLRSRPSGQT